MRFPLLRPESTHYLTMDALRVVAAVGVVAFHYKESVATPSVRLFLEVTLSRGYQFVDLFFVLSGFIIAAVYGDRLQTNLQFRNFMIKRFARLWPLHVLLLMLYLGLVVCVTLAEIQINDTRRYDPFCILPNLLLVHSIPFCSYLTFNYVSWSISAEMFMYLLSPIFFAVSRRPIILLTLCLLMLFGLGFLPAERPWQSWTYDFGFVRALPAFALGVLVYRCRATLRVPFPHEMLLMFFFGFFVLSWLNAPVWASLLSVYMIAILAAAADAKNNVPSWIRKVANFSSLTYGIYMWHPFVYTIGFAFVAEDVLDLSALSRDLALFILVPTTALVAYFSLNIFEKPLRKAIVNAMARPA